MQIQSCGRTAIRCLPCSITGFANRLKYTSCTLFCQDRITLSRQKLMGSALCSCLNSAAKEDLQKAHSIPKKDPQSQWHRRRKTAGHVSGSKADSAPTWAMSDEYQILDELSVGADATVFKIMHKPSSTLHACKTVVKHQMIGRSRTTSNRSDPSDLSDRVAILHYCMHASDDHKSRDLMTSMRGA